MKKLFVALFALCLLAAVPAFASGFGGSSGVGGMPGAPVFSGTVSSTKATASNYTRDTPNQSTLATACVGSGCETATTVATTCTAINLESGTAGDRFAAGDASKAKSVLLKLLTNITTGTAGQTWVGTKFYSDSGCTSVLSGISGQFYAVGTTSGFPVVHIAASTGTSVTWPLTSMVLIRTNGASTIYAKKTESLGTGATDSVAVMAVLGYFD